MFRTTSKMKRFFSKSMYIYLFFGIMIGILYGNVLNNFWLFDDLQILRQAEKYRPWEYFFVPEAWQELSVSNFTPLVTLSFDIDFSLFDFNPKWFYLHHLISLWFVSIMLYFVLKLWVPHIFAMFGVLLFLVSAPVGLASEFLMVRHYIEGSALILLSFFMNINALRRNSFTLACAAALPYFFAISGKEIYVPLAIIVLFMPEKKWLSRLKYASPLLGTLILYFVWRDRMLGRPLGGYNDTLFGSHILSEINRIMIKIPIESVKMLFGMPAFGSAVHVIIFVFITILFFGSVLLCISRRKYSVLLFFAILLSMVYAPISFNFLYLSAADFTTYRWVYFISLVYSALVALMTYYLLDIRKNSIIQLPPRIRFVFQWVIPLSCMTLLLVLFLSAYQWLSIQRKTIIKPLSREGIFLMNNDNRSLMVKTFVLPINNYYENLEYFKMLYIKRPLPIVVYETYVYLDDETPSQLDGISIYKYSSNEDSMIEITHHFLKKRIEYISHIKKLPFEVRLTVKKALFNFSLGPSASGRYFVLGGYRPNIYCSATYLARTLPSNIYGGYVKWYLRFGWESPDGWIALSPEWFFDFSKDQEIFWKQ